MRWLKSMRWRYSLRALLVFITLFMLWGGYHAGRSWPERRAELVVRPWEVEFHRGPTRPNSLLGYPVYGYQRLVQVLWRERFITRVTIYVDPKPEAVEAIAALPDLEMLSVYRPSTDTGEGIRRIAVPDGSIERILANHKLHTIEIEGADLGEADLRAIARHRSLRRVSFCLAGLSEDGLAAIATLPQLEHLGFSYCNVSGAKLASVTGTPVLHFVECQEAPVGNEFAAFVSRCPNLRHLNIATPSYSGRSIGDDFVAAIGPHPSLERIDLRCTRVTDQSIDTLVQMPSLRYVVLPRGGVISPSAMQRLQKSRPKVHVAEL